MPKIVFSIDLFTIGDCRRLSTRGAEHS
jgi:hypothetical protein